MKILVSDEIEKVCPSFVGAHVEISVRNTPYSEGLWNEINRLGQQLRATLTTETLKDISGIAATRRVYRACGKDPSRYRPAAEALIRRMQMCIRDRATASRWTGKWCRERRRWTKVC